MIEWFQWSVVPTQIESLDQLNEKLNVFLGAYNEIEKLSQMDLVFFKVNKAKYTALVAPR